MKRAIAAIAIVAVVVALAIRCFRKRLVGRRRAGRSRRGDVLPSHAALPDVPQDGQLHARRPSRTDSPRRSRTARSSSTSSTSRTRRTQALTKGYKVERPHVDRRAGRRQQGEGAQEPDGDVDEGRRQGRVHQVRAEQRERLPEVAAAKHSGQAGVAEGSTSWSPICSTPGPLSIWAC